MIIDMTASAMEQNLNKKQDEVRKAKNDWVGVWTPAFALKSVPEHDCGVVIFDCTIQCDSSMSIEWSGNCVVDAPIVFDVPVAFNSSVTFSSSLDFSDGRFLMDNF